MRYLVWSLAILSLLAISAPASADDLWPPSYRGNAGTIFAKWDQWNAPPGARLPDTWSHGEGALAGTGSPTVSAPLSTVLPAYESRTNVLTFPVPSEPSETEGVLVIDLPNFEEPPLGAWGKGVWVQITCWTGGAGPSAFLEVSAGSDADHKEWMFEGWDDNWVNAWTPNCVENGGWVTMAFNVYGLPADTEWETIKFSFSCGLETAGYAYVDQVVVDTAFVSIPEPMTLSLLALGGLAVLKRRRMS